MSPGIWPVAAATLTALLGTGVLLLILGLRRRPASSARNSSRPRRPVSKRTLILVSVGLVAGLVVWLTTGWALAVLLLPLVAISLPIVLVAPTDRAGLHRLADLAQWSRSLAGVVHSGAGLEQAIKKTGTSLPDSVRPQLTRLIARLNAGMNPRRALRLLADDLNDGTADQLVVYLLVAVDKRGDGLSLLLQRTADRVQQAVDTRLKIEAERAKPRANARWITLIILGVTAALPLTGDYVAPYGTVLGSVILMAALTVMFLLLLWMRGIVAERPQPRLLAPVTTPTAVTATPSSPGPARTSTPGRPTPSTTAAHLDARTA